MRLLNRPLAFILAAALTVAAIIVIIEVIAFNVHHGPLVLHWTTWYHWASRTRGDRQVVRVWSAILILIGLLILAIGRRQARVSAVAAACGRPATEALTQPVTQAVQDRLDQLDLRHSPHLRVRVSSRSR